MKAPSLKSQAGQVIIEYILMLVIVLSVSYMMRAFLLKTNFIQNFTFQPWARLNGMIQCGVWAPCGVETPTANLHPNTAGRVLSYNPIF